MMKTTLLSPEDMVVINEQIRPKNKKAVIFVVSAMFGFCVLLPFVPGKHSRQSPFIAGNYWEAFLFYFVVFGVMAGLLYYRSIMNLDKDVKDGEKIIAKLPVKYKNGMTRRPKVEIGFERGKLLHKPKSMLEKEEAIKWQVGDLVEMELLYKSGEILRYKKVIE